MLSDEFYPHRNTMFSKACGAAALLGDYEGTIILLSGQSNMVGEGGVNASSVWDRIVPAESQPNPRVFRLNSELECETAQEPLHLGISSPCGVGPGLPFANAALRPREVITLVPCAQIMTTITQWQRGTRLYDRLLSRAQAAVASGGGGLIRTMLWYQGEADTYMETAAKAYRAGLVQFFNDLRSDLNLPFLPIIQVALASGGNFTEMVRSVQLNTGLHNVYCVDALTLNVTIQNDSLNVHLDTPSQVKLGQAMASLYLNVTAV